MKLVHILFLTVQILAGFAFSAHAHPPRPATDSSCARYLGNAGVLVTSGDSRILFDAFYSENYGQYALVPELTHQALVQAKAPYDDIDALFVSHVHGDHFSPKPTLAFLQANPEVHLYASQQVIDALKQADNEQQVSQRLHAFALQAGEPSQQVKLGNIHIEAVRIPHAGGERTASIENLAFRVSLDQNLTVLHLGDADPNDELFAPHKAHWDSKKLDIAFPPYWFLGSDAGRLILDNRLKAEQTIGVHVPIEAQHQGDLWRAQYGGDLFTDPGEIRAFAEAGCAVSTAQE